MLLNDPKHNSGEEASVSLKVLLLVLAVVVVGTLGYFVYRENRTSIDTGEEFQISNVFKKKATATVTATTTPVVGATATAACVDTFLYTNVKYNFTLNLPCSWSTYKIKEADITGEIDTYYINLPTADALYTTATASDGHYAGYINVMAFGVMTKADWTGSEDQMREFGDKVGENANFVFTASRMNGAYPADLTASLTNAIFSQVMNSFKLL